MKIFFIGTGSGRTSLRRNHSSFLISNGNDNLLVDCGDGTSKALLQQSIDINSINSLVITHLHADHYSGVASLITQMKLLKRQKPFSIYIHKNFVSVVREFLNSTYMFSETVGFDLKITGYDFLNSVSLGENFSFAAKQNSHIIKKAETNIYPEEIFVSSSLFIKCSDKNIFYSSDVGSAKDLYLFKDHSADLMITESSHITLDEILESFQSLNPSQLFITHISDEIETELISWHQNLLAKDKNRISICHDGLSVIPA